MVFGGLPQHTGGFSDWPKLVNRRRLAESLHIDHPLLGAISIKIGRDGDVPSSMDVLRYSNPDKVHFLYCVLCTLRLGGREETLNPCAVPCLPVIILDIAHASERYPFVSFSFIFL